MLTILLFKIAVAAYINNVLNLMPLLLLDGYWILEEWVETPKLRQKALEFVRGPFWHRLLDRRRLVSLPYRFHDAWIGLLHLLDHLPSPLRWSPSIVFRPGLASVSRP